MTSSRRATSLAEPLLDKSADAMDKLERAAADLDTSIRKKLTGDIIERLPPALAVTEGIGPVGRTPAVPAPLPIIYDEQGERMND